MKKVVILVLVVVSLASVGGRFSGNPVKSQVPGGATSATWG